MAGNCTRHTMLGTVLRTRRPVKVSTRNQWDGWDGRMVRTPFVRPVMGWEGRGLLYSPVPPTITPSFSSRKQKCVCPSHYRGDTIGATMRFAFRHVCRLRGGNGRLQRITVKLAPPVVQFAPQLRNPTETELEPLRSPRRPFAAGERLGDLLQPTAASA